MSSAKLKVAALRSLDLEALKIFTDKNIGQDYYSRAELQDIFERSAFANGSTSFLLLENSEIVGIRISYAPGRWTHGKGLGLKPELWKLDIGQVGYFQSLFLSEKIQGQGWGQRLSEVALETLKTLGAKAVVCHSWVESPNDSSRKYLKKMGFQTVASHPQYWKLVDYTCTRCGKPCLCTAEEMIKYLE